MACCGNPNDAKVNSRRKSAGNTARKGAKGPTQVHIDALCTACYTGEFGTVQRLVERGTDPHAVRPAWTAPTGGYWVNVAPLWIAAYQGQLGIVQYLVEEAQVKIGQVGSFERSTPLEAAGEHWQCPGCFAALPAPELRLNPPCCDQCGQAFLDTRSPWHQQVVSYLKAAAEAEASGNGAAGLGSAWRAAPERPATATTSETAGQLQQLKLTELRCKALAAGLSNERVDAALDSELPREALIALLLEMRPASAPGLHGSSSIAPSPPASPARRAAGAALFLSNNPVTALRRSLSHRGDSDDEGLDFVFNEETGVFQRTAAMYNAGIGAFERPCGGGFQAQLAGADDGTDSGSESNSGSSGSGGSVRRGSAGGGVGFFTALPPGPRSACALLSHAFRREHWRLTWWGALQDECTAEGQAEGSAAGRATAAVRTQTGQGDRVERRERCVTSFHWLTLSIACI
jgi:hypothetical protein